MGEPVNLVRPDGSILQVHNPENAETLRALGYSEESDSAAFERNRQTAREDYYEGQKLETFAEGVAGGLTFGATDQLFENAFGWDTAERAQYNPGTRIAGDITGAVLPALLSGGASAPESAAGIAGRVLRATPAGLVARGAEAAAPLLTSSRVGRATVRGVIEGAAYGGGAEVTNAALNDDPLTAEALVAGMGWGALFGGGLSALVSKAGVAAESYAAKRATETADHFIPVERWGAFSTSVDDAVKAAKSTVTAAEASVLAEKAAPLSELSKVALAERQAAQDALINEVTAARRMVVPMLTYKDAAVSSLKKATTAAAKGDFKAFTRHFDEHAQKMKLLSESSGVAHPELAPFVDTAASRSTKALEEVRDLSAAHEALRTFPVTLEGFARTSPQKMERHIAAVETFLSGPGGAELEGVRSALATSIKEMTESAGLAIEGSPGKQLRGLWEKARASRTVAGREATQSIAGQVANRTARYAAGSAAAHAVGGRVVGHVLRYTAGAAVATGLLGLKGAVTGAIQDSVAKWGPRVTRTAEKAGVGARIDPLRTRLNGTVDEGKKSRRELMLERAEEIRRAAPSVRDTLYRSVEALATEHPLAAAAIHKHASAQFDALSARLPRDPGNAITRMRSIWAPDTAQTERFARYYEVFQNPVAVVVRSLSEGRITREHAQALREMNPELFQSLRVGMLARLSEPGALDKMTLNEQVSIGELLDITVHSMQSPRFIAQQQLMFKKRNEPLPTRAPGGSASTNPSGGRPAGASAATAITDH